MIDNVRELGRDASQAVHFHKYIFRVLDESPSFLKKLRPLHQFLEIRKRIADVELREIRDGVGMEPKCLFNFREGGKDHRTVPLPFSKGESVELCQILEIIL